MNFWYWLLSWLPFEWAALDTMLFMKNALLAVLVVTPLFGLLSTMVVESRMAFFSDALGHSAFTGMAIGALCGLAQPVGAAVLFSRGHRPALYPGPAENPHGQRHGHQCLLLRCRGPGHF
ncbi:MAG: metal ABC transporter permease [Evtepia gabavorous]